MCIFTKITKKQALRYSYIKLECRIINKKILPNEQTT